MAEKLQDPLYGMGGSKNRTCFFFCLTTIEALKEGVTLDEAVQRGELFRNFTAPVIITTLGGPIVIAGGIELGPVVVAEGGELLTSLWLRGSTTCLANPVTCTEIGGGLAEGFAYPAPAIFTAAGTLGYYYDDFANAASRAVVWGDEALEGAYLTLTNGGACFVAGTPVWTRAGTQSIETIKVGDIVVSRDGATQQTVLKPVVRVFKSTSPHALHLTLERADGKTETITTTKGHPFHIPGRGFVFAGNLRVGDLVSSGGQVAQSALLLTSSKDNDASGVLRVKALSLEDRATAVYNFEVAETHTYFVGQSHAWVHNQSVLRVNSDKAVAPAAILAFMNACNVLAQ